MVFTESKFVVFLLIVFCVYWSLTTLNQRKNWLLLASYVFYASWDYRFSALLFASTIIDYYAALRIHATPRRVSKKLWLAISLISNLGILGVFKYFDFFVSSFASLAQLAGLRCDPYLLNIALPVGISFYTFQALSYTIDVYRGESKLFQSLRDFMLYISFFPQLVAGPIVRAGEYRPQIEKLFPWDRVDFRGAALFLAAGYFKKAVVADNIAFYIDPVFESPLEFSRASTWVAVYSYCVQMYCDFSGYSDIAVGLGKLFGIELPMNFRYPLFSVSLTDFWRRWHLTLSSWIRDYVYVSMGGGQRNRMFNLIVTMSLVGLWHGASAKFLVFGIVNGVVLVLEGFFFQHLGRHALQWSQRSFPLAAAFFSILYGQLILALIHILFRAPDLAHAGMTARRFLGLDTAGSQTIDSGVLIFFVAFWAIHLAGRLNGDRLLQKWRLLPELPFAAGYGFLWALLFSLAIRAFQPFVYFAF